jgi:uncharacterized protein (DUF1697 family)
MPRYVAFLRAINVGGHTVRMEQLRSLFEAMGFSKVETFIASGNVIFDSASRNTRSVEVKIEAVLKKELGYPVETFIRTFAELAAIADYKPFSESELNAEGHTVYVGFLAASPSTDAVQKLKRCASEVNDFQVFGREVYWLIRGKFSDTPFSGARLEKILGMKTTLRNSSTIRRLTAR